MSNCDKCGYYCKSAKYLLKHQKAAKYCAKYQYIIFFCKRCNFNTKGIKNIEEHLVNCNSKHTSTKNPLSDLVKSKQLIQDEKSNLEIKITQLEINLRNKDLDIMDLRLRIQFEQMKNKIYTNIIQTQTNIKVDNIIQENKDDIHIFNFKNGKIPLVIHEFSNQKSEQYIIEPFKMKK